MSEATLIQSVQRALRLVEELGTRGSAVAKELARATGLPVSTTYHLLRTLAYEGYVCRESDGTYHLGPAFRTIAESSQHSAVLTRARPVMRALRDQLKAPVYLALYDDGEISVVEIAASPSVPGIDLWVGIHESAHATALGKSVLSLLAPQARADYLARHPLHALTQHTVTDRVNLEAQIAKAGATARDDEEYLTGVRCLAAPVMSHHHIGALAVAHVLTKRNLVVAPEKLLLDAADRIARSLAMPA